MPLQLMDIAGGAGRYLLDVLDEPDLKILCRDWSESALARGRESAQQLGLSERITHLRGDAFDEASLASVEPKPSVAVVSGLYELFPENDKLQRSLRGLFSAVNPGGYLIYTGQPWHPQVEMIARTLTRQGRHVAILSRGYKRRAPKVPWRQRLARRPARARIGLVWGGRPEADYERRRAVPFEMLARLGKHADVAWYALQSGDRSGDAQAHADRIAVEVLTPAELGTFADTAALLAELDLLITVDTAFCHLAGAIGAPAWLMLPTAPDWRWSLQEDRTPWYPSVRIFRQPSPGDWAGMLAQLSQALRQALDQPAGAARFSPP
jgi:SAM-dependent methyltransferase